MVSTAKELRFHTKELLESISRGEEVIITYHGKPYAKLVPYEKSANDNNNTDELFGMWKNRKETEDVDGYVRKLRRKRY